MNGQLAWHSMTLFTYFGCTSTSFRHYFLFLHLTHLLNTHNLSIWPFTHRRLWPKHSAVSQLWARTAGRQLTAFLSQSLNQGFDGFHWAEQWVPTGSDAAGQRGWCQALNSLAWRYLGRVVRDRRGVRYSHVFFILWKMKVTVECFICTYVWLHMCAGVKMRRILAWPVYPTMN